MKMVLRGRPKSVNKPSEIEMHFGHEFVVGDDKVAVARIEKELAEIELAAGRLEKYVEQNTISKATKTIKKTDAPIIAKENKEPEVKA